MGNSVLFLAPAIRTGAGGVADYCRRLSGALVGKGFECHLASWSEREADLPQSASGAVRTLFLEQEGGSTIAAKAERLREYIEQHRIEWVSLQFVNFGFANRGLIFGLGNTLSHALSGKRVHLCLHELWVRDHAGRDFRKRLLGAVQRRQLLHLVATLRPEQVWTSIDYYARQLARVGIQAAVVPIFGNISISDARADDLILQRLDPLPTGHQREKYFFVGLFGTIDSSWPYRRVIPQIVQIAGARKVVFVLFGRNGDTQAFADYVKSLASADLISLGPLDETVVDQVMNSMDVALATTPAEGTFKSGSAVAFLERGVPTVACWHGLDKEGATMTQRHPSLVLADECLEQNFRAAATARQLAPLLPSVAEAYAELFKSAPPSDR